jgi:succinate dehydrogenase / fumarate reductase flavoprotein subunit
MHYSMGGLWVDHAPDARNGTLDENSPRNQATNVPGLYAAGEVEYQYHGANRLGANSLVACIYAGKIGGPAMVRYGREAAGKLPGADGALAGAKKQWESEFARLAGLAGPENPHRLAEEMGDWMTVTTRSSPRPRRSWKSSPTAGTGSACPTGARSPTARSPSSTSFATCSCSRAS